MCRVLRIQHYILLMTKKIIALPDSRDNIHTDHQTQRLFSDFSGINSFLFLVFSMILIRLNKMRHCSRSQGGGRVKILG